MRQQFVSSSRIVHADLAAAPRHLDRNSSGAQASHSTEMQTKMATRPAYFWLVVLLMVCLPGKRLLRVLALCYEPRGTGPPFHFGPTILVFAARKVRRPLSCAGTGRRVPPSERFFRQKIQIPHRRRWFLFSCIVLTTFPTRLDEKHGEKCGRCLSVLIFHFPAWL